MTQGDINLKFTDFVKFQKFNVLWILPLCQLYSTALTKYLYQCFLTSGKILFLGNLWIRKGYSAKNLSKFINLDRFFDIFFERFFGHIFNRFLKRQNFSQIYWQIFWDNLLLDFLDFFKVLRVLYLHQKG